MEVARGLGELLKTGWRPKRTIVLALWDGEEWGLLGSTEWAEEHARRAERQGRRLHQHRRHRQGLARRRRLALAAAVHQRGRPRRQRPEDRQARAGGGPQAKRSRALPEAERAEAEKDANIRIAPLGSGSDFTPFLQHLTLASLNLGFGGESPGGVYHSVYDSFEWYTKYSDGEFVYGRTLSQLTGTAVLRLSEARCCRSASRTCRTRSPATWPRCRSCTRQEGRAGHRLRAARGRRRGAVEARRRRSRRRMPACRRPRPSAADAAGGAEGGEPAGLLVGAPPRQRAGPAAPRLVPPPDLRARLLHGLRREDAAADSRGPRGRAVGRGASRA